MKQTSWEGSSCR